MTADGLAVAGHAVTVVERRPNIAWKLFIAGGSGLNISNNLPLEAFAKHYSGPSSHWLACLQDFPAQAWLQFIEQKLGIGTFLGTSNRYFVETMHAALLVRQWRRRLEDLSVRFLVKTPCIDFQKREAGWELFAPDRSLGIFDQLVFALGGGSYEPGDQPLAWPSLFTNKGVTFRPFTPSNTGYEVAWSAAFLQEAEGQPIKNICLRSVRGERKGDLVITNYGLEGTPIYFAGRSGAITLDLKPDLSFEQVRERLQKSRENLSPMRRAQKFLQLCTGSKALLFHMAPREQIMDLEVLAALIKAFPLELGAPRPLTESISAAGGLAWENFDEGLMLRHHPGIYCAGEMLDWDAPTGGFLIQGCVAQGHWVSQSVLSR
jgi:uncharacterized flavoprotein (TIGR03862 family)